ncbi:hypothetical protein JZ751_007074 [Albula glossodonta]|uniref:Uncharacterized protein n=1 Tax=Albula glossodonta TaxID=121402 RepID=A0A8T2PDE1_9TELE|nr:hypothetical protein JZ751_007074 [Albula glossodonta]
MRTPEKIFSPSRNETTSASSIISDSVSLASLHSVCCTSKSSGSESVGAYSTFSGGSVESQENYDEFLKRIGIPDDVIEKGRSFKTVTEVVQNGNEFTWSQIYPNKTLTNKFIIGQECEMETMSGTKFKCCTVSGAKGALTMKRTSKRV